MKNGTEINVNVNTSIPFYHPRKSSRQFYKMLYHFGDYSVKLRISEVCEVAFFDVGFDGAEIDARFFSEETRLLQKKDELLEP